MVMTILVVEDHAVVREGIRKLLATQSNPMIMEAADVDSGIMKFKERRPDVVLLDLNLGDTGGFELLRRMLAEDPRARVLIFSMNSDPLYASRALRAGAKGYVSKSAPADELLLAIRKVSEGGQYVDREVAARLAVSQITADDPFQKLTARELEILRQLGKGASLTEISNGLGVAYKTIANTCTHIKVKLGVERTADLIRLSVEKLQDR